MNLDSAYCLQICDLAYRVGSRKLLSGVSLNLPRGQRCTLIGKNGAGKTTLLNVLSGVVSTGVTVTRWLPNNFQRLLNSQLFAAQMTGSIFLNGKKINNLSVTQRRRLGLSRNFQRIELFDSLTVTETFSLANTLRKDKDFYSAVAFPGYSLFLLILNFYQESDLLQACKNKKVRDLPYAEKRLLDVALTLMPPSDLVVLDEPFAGLQGAAYEAMLRLLKQIPAEVTLLLVEHDLVAAAAVSTHVALLSLNSMVDEDNNSEKNQMQKNRNSIVTHIPWLALPQKIHDELNLLSHYAALSQFSID